MDRILRNFLALSAPDGLDLGPMYVGDEYYI